MRVQVIGLPELSAKFNRVISRIGSLETEFAEIGLIMTKFYSTQPFLSQGSIYGTPWKPLSLAYAKEKERKYPGRGILVASGKMMDSFTAISTPMSVTITNTAEYFAKHQKGEGVPQRISMMLDTQRRSLVVKTLADRLRIKIAEAWL